MSTTIFNRHWSRVILHSLYTHGVRHVCIAPGSRSTPLILEAATHPSLTCHTHFDERGLAFLALGLAKSQQQPIAIIVTSGTAVANLYPAIIEANLTGERLIVLTADRPPELIDCGANQAIHQPGIFAQHVNVALNLPRPTSEISASWLSATIDDGCYRLTQGVMHINVPFAEPLYGIDDGEISDWLAPLNTWRQQVKPWVVMPRPIKQINRLSDWSYWQQQHGIIIAGRLTAEEGKAVREWSEQLGWPLLADALSSTGQPLAMADIWLNHPQAQQILTQADIVIHFGANPLGKRLLMLLAKVRCQQYWSITEQRQRIDSHHHQGRRIHVPIIDWLAAHPIKQGLRWATDLLPIITHGQTITKIKLADRFSEALVAAKLPELLPAKGQLFIGNSLIVRLIDALAQLPIGYPVYSNRGASGIDGLIATLAGIRQSQRPTLAIIGDMSALYDLNSLSLLTDSGVPTVLIIVNNNGGSIFSLLPTPEEQRNQFYRMPHGLQFEHAANMFHLAYSVVTDWQTLQNKINGHWQQQGTLLLEIQVPEDEGAELLQSLIRQMAILPC